MPPRPFSLSLRAGMLAAALLVGGGLAYAQIEGGGGGGAAPVDSSGSFEVSGVAVDVAGKTAEDARLAGWRLAQRKGWSLLSQRLTGRAGGLADSSLDAITMGIIVENEQIGPNRYVARLGVLFDRSRAASILGVSGFAERSPPMLVVPVLWSGGAGQVFEQPSPWQAAWARFRTGNTTVDYVRPSGTGPDALLLNAGQQGRRGRGWWRAIIDQYGADDVLFPEVRLHRSWPGGPIVGVFRAGYGPDNREVARFSLRVENADGLDALLDAGVRRMDEAYQQGLRSGMIQPDRLLGVEPPDPEAEAAAAAAAAAAAEAEAAALEASMAAEGDALVSSGATFTYSIQFDTPSVANVTSTEAAVRGIPGVRSAVTNSLALGGTSVMTVSYDADLAVLRAALEARGWQVEQGGSTLRIRRASGPTPPPAPPPPPQPEPADAQ